MHGADINKYIESGRLSGIDIEGNFDDLAPWSEAEVGTRAHELGIELTEAHWELLVYLREHYIIHGPVESAQRLARELGEAFKDEGGRRYLYGLFPGGPVSQGSYIAGVPLPPHHNDRSFGSIE
jgi:tRNA 2-thiouridine synthesizing protein E